MLMDVVGQSHQYRGSIDASDLRRLAPATIGNQKLGIARALTGGNDTRFTTDEEA